MGFIGALDSHTPHFATRLRTRTSTQHTLSPPTKAVVAVEHGRLTDVNIPLPGQLPLVKDKSVRSGSRQQVVVA